MFVARIAARSASVAPAPVSYRPVRAQTACRKSSSSVTTTTPTSTEVKRHPDHLEKLSKALETNDQATVLEIADALEKIRSSMTREEKAALAAEAQEDLKELEKEHPDAVAQIKSLQLKHEQLHDAIPHWENGRGYLINTVDDLEKHWQQWLSSHVKKDTSGQLKKMFAEGGADFEKTDVCPPHPHMVPTYALIYPLLLMNIATPYTHSHARKK